ncbi:MAG: hypothetical protein DRP01_08665 [Archaeoglobales archaeon]|nr:MAG: hypothetical protein DRP01_08665 [Archaeoglobales archaeon]
MEWEVFEVESLTRSVKVENGKIKVFETWKEKKVGVRVIENGRVGFVTSNEFDRDLIEIARKIARVSEERLDVFPEGGYVGVEGIYDRRFEDLTPDEIKDFVESMINPVVDLGVNPALGSIEFTVESVSIRNSFGADLGYRSTLCSAYLESVYEDSSGFEMDESRRFADFEFVGRRSAELARESKNPRKIEGIYSLILSPIAIHQILAHTLYPAISLENVLKGRSPLRINDSFGEMTILDDGTYPCGLFTAPFDDEGVETRRKIIFEDGCLRSYITDFGSAVRSNFEPTGNGFRGDDLYPVTSPTNVILEFGYETEELEGVYVHSFIGAHTSNPASGDFSLKTMNAFFKDESVYAMIYGNVYDLLGKIEAFGKDVRQIENTVTPSIEFREVRFV